MERAHLQKTVVLFVSLLSLSSASAAQRVTRLPSLSQLLSEDLSTTIVGIDYRIHQRPKLACRGGLTTGAHRVYALS
jgi:hypothetical protein